MSTERARKWVENLRTDAFDKAIRELNTTPDVREAIRAKMLDEERSDGKKVAIAKLEAELEELFKKLDVARERYDAELIALTGTADLLAASERLVGELDPFAPLPNLTPEQLIERVKGKRHRENLQESDELGDDHDRLRVSAICLRRHST